MHLKRISLMIIFIFLQLFSQSETTLVKSLHQTIKHDEDFSFFFPKQTENQKKFDVTFYDLYFDIKIDPELIYGETRVKARALSDVSLVELDLSSFMQVDSVFINDTSNLTFHHNGNLISATLNDTIKSGDFFNITVYYHGAPASSGFGSFEWSSSQVSGYKVFWTLSEPYGAKDWWPCKNTPKDKADSVYLHVTVPEDYKVAANGLLKAVTTNAGKLTYWWVHRHPIATYLVAINGAPFVEINDTLVSGEGWTMPMQHFVYPSWDSEETRNNLTRVKDMIKAFNFYFGDYPFKNEKYGIAQFGWGGGMEHQTMTYQGSFYTNLCSHELGHQWFGDNVTCADFHHIWLNEGFASYCEAAYSEWTGGKDGYQSYIRNNFYNRSLTFTAPIYVENVDEEDPYAVNNIFNSIVYKKGAMIVHMLRRMINNDEQFRQLLSSWNNIRNGYGDSSATTEDLSRFVSDFTGEDYSWFFNDWIYLPYHPVYKINWEYIGDGVTEIIVKQTQITETRGFYRMKLPITLSNGSQDTSFTVFNDTQDQIFMINTGFIPDQLDFDPDYSVLKEIEGIYQFIGDTKLPTDFTLLGNYPNPFNPSTQIRFYNPVLSSVRLVIYNALGQKIQTIKQSAVHSGFNRIEWDGYTSNHTPVNSGVYFYRLEFIVDKSKTIAKSGKMILLR